MPKLICGGLVAVIVSPTYGAGWSTWGDSASCLDGELAQAILDKSPNISDIAATNWPDQYQGGLETSQVKWVLEGTRFEIREYDGAESLHIFTPDEGMIA